LHDFDHRGIYRAFPDALPALRWSKERGLRTGVLSNTPLVDLRDLLRVLGLSDLIDCVSFRKAAVSRSLRRPPTFARWHYSRWKPRNVCSSTMSWPTCKAR
jgi:hypothetical protein